MIVDDQSNILKSESLGLILLFTVAPGTPTLSLRLSEREVYGRFIYLSIYPSIASKVTQRRDEYVKGNFKKKDILERVRYLIEEW